MTTTIVIVDVSGSAMAAQGFLARVELGLIALLGSMGQQERFCLIASSTEAELVIDTQAGNIGAAAAVDKLRSWRGTCAGTNMPIARELAQRVMQSQRTHSGADANFMVAEFSDGYGP